MATPASATPPVPALVDLFQRLAPVRARLVTEILPPLLDSACQTWYSHTVTGYLAQELRTRYHREVITRVARLGQAAMARYTCAHITVTPHATGAPTITVTLNREPDPAPVPLLRSLTQRYQGPAWQVVTERLALELSRAASARVQQAIGMDALAALPAPVFTSTVAAAVLDATLPPLAIRLREHLTVQAQHDALERADKLASRAPTPQEYEDLLGLRGSTNRPARLLALLRQDHVTVLSAAHYHAVRTALAHNTFQEAEGLPWPTAVLATGPARGHVELRPLVADATSWMAPEIVEAWARRMWEQRGALSDLDADALDALCALWLRQARTPDEDAIADVDDLLAMRELEPKQRGQGRRSGYEPEQRQALLQALTHLQNLWLHMTEVEMYLPTSPGSRRRKRTTQGVQSRLFTITDLLGHTRPDGWFEVEKFIFRPGKVLAHFLHGPGRQTALLSARALTYDPYRQVWEKRLLRYLSWQWRTRAHAGDYGQVYRVDTLLEAIGEAVDPRRMSAQKERFDQAFDTLLADDSIAAWQYQERDVGQWWRSTVVVEPPEVIRATYQRLRRHEAPTPRALPTATTELGAQLKQRRLGLGLSQLQAAEQLAISQAYLSLLERGAKPRVSAALQRKITTWLGAPETPAPDITAEGFSPPEEPQA